MVICTLSGADLGILQRGGGSGPEFFEGGVKVQVRGNFHILTYTKKKNQPLKGGGLNPLPPPLDPLLLIYQARRLVWKRWGDFTTGAGAVVGRGCLGRLVWCPNSSTI